MVRVAKGEDAELVARRAVESLRGTIRLRGTVDASRVVGIETQHGIISKRQILHASRHRPDVIEARHEWKASRPAEPTICRLQSKNPAA